MQFRHVVFMFVLGALAFGCGASRSRAVDVARKVGVPTLRGDLQVVVASPAGHQHQIPQTAWPESVQRFRPLAVELHMKGVLIVLTRSGRVQEGLLVMLDPKDDPGAGGSGAGYDSVGDGLYWCWEKIRTPYISQGQRTNR
jgi:hypothetical protein